MINPKNNKDLFYPIIVKEVDNECYLYNITTNGIFLMDNNAYDVIINNSNIYDEKYKDIKEFFEKNLFLGRKAII